MRNKSNRPLEWSLGVSVLFLADGVGRVCVRGGLLFAVAVLLAGCGGGTTKLDLPALHPVSGTVTYQGRAAAGFRVTFNPVASTGKLTFSPQAITDEFGAYQLEVTKTEAGAPVGDFVVTFEWPDHINKFDDPDPVPEQDRLRGVYSNPASSTFKYKVQPGDNVVPVFAIP